MTRTARILVAIAIACALSLSYSLYNLRNLSRNITYDEVYYYYWVDNWENNQVYYPQHLLFTATSVVFQQGFAALTGITDTAFIQRFKNILLVAVGLSAFFLLFYAYSKRLLLSLTIAFLIGITGSLWSGAQHHETSAIPGVLINLTMFSLVFYRRFRPSVLFIAVFSVFNSFAILLHQAFLFSVPCAALVFLFSRPQGDAAPRPVRNLGRSALYLFLVACMVGGTYFYVGFVKLNLRLRDNTEGTQTYMAVPIHGNFIRYFYLIQAYGKWGKTQPAMLGQGIGGYLSSFVTTFRMDKVDPRDPLGEDHFAATVTLVALGSLLLCLLLFIVPMVRRHGALYPALLLWLGMGSLFVIWWEPGEIEHWIYIAVLTWVLAFMVIAGALERIRPFLPRIVVYAAVCLALWSFASVAYRENFTHSILAQKALSIPASVDSYAWKDEYRMDSIYRTSLLNTNVLSR